MDHAQGDTIEGTLVDANAPAEWNPLGEVTPETIPLEASGGRCSIKYRRWTGRERLAYEDAITEKLLTTDERTGDDTVRLGSMRLFAASLTIVGSEGFEIVGLDGFLQGDRESREEDLLKITDPDTYSEIIRTATRIQPLPGSENAGKRDGETDDDEDPSRTPSTPPRDAGVE